ncbi:MAG: hypothetical protein OQK12_08500 [Motiliproteus sp.]|nr:hypothetical protein [Motiliproteus sp.]MCW9051188.1 hypothetical protein [Motiliproteus sp.]
MLNQFLTQRQQQKFQQALLEADETLLRKTISKGADINAPFAISTGEEFPPLVHAINTGCANCMRILLEADAAIPQQEDQQLALLEQAITSDTSQLALLSVLLEFGVDPNVCQGQAFFQCLKVSDSNLQLLLITRLMEHGGQINVRDEHQISVLDHLMLAEQTQLVGSLITAGAEPSEPLDKLPCSDEIKAFALRKKQDLEIQRMLLGH